VVAARASSLDDPFYWDALNLWRLAEVRGRVATTVSSPASAASA